MKPSIRSKGTETAVPTLRTRLAEFFDTENFFDAPFWPGLLFRNGVHFQNLPATNIRETDEGFIVELAAPGLEKDDFQLDVNNGCLEIKVEKEAESETKGEQFSRREYSYNSFHRSFILPEKVLTEKIKAEYRDGVLKVLLPKVAEEKTKPIKKVKVV